jgi:rhodanese-related sulfurtransferase
MSSFPEIPANEAKQRLAQFRIVDVREPHEFGGPLGHIEGAELVPLAQVEAEAARFAGGRSLLLVCRSGGRSGRACEKLVVRGLDVTNLAGGMIGWNRAGLPVVEPRFASEVELCRSIEAWLAQLSGRERAAASADVTGWLRAAGASETAPTASALERVLEQAARALGGEKAPADLEMSLRAFRAALAAVR